MSRYDDIDAIITALGGSATADEVEFALRDYPDREVRTVLAERAAAGGGGAGLLQVASVTLNDATYKALPTNAPEIVPAPGAGFAIMPMGLAISHPAIVAYTNVSTSGGYMVMSDPTDNVAEYGGYFVNNDLSIVLAGPGAVIAYHQGLPADPSGGAIPPEYLVEDSAVHLHVDNAGQGDFTGGNAANTLKITVYYVVLDVS